MTVFANAPALFDLLLLLPILAVSYYPRRESGTPLPSSAGTPREADAPIKVVAPLPALTTYRAHMMLMTILAILAVDFPVFPRSLAKCESFGVSLVCSYPHCLQGGLTVLCRWTSASALSCSRKE